MPLFLGLLCAFLCGWLPDASAVITPEDYAATKVELGTRAFGLKQRTFALRSAGKIDLNRGSQLTGAAELADSVRLLMEQGIRYQAHPEDQPEVLTHVLIQLRYLNEHTAANFDEEEYWDREAKRLNALGPPSYNLARLIIERYLPAVEYANEIAQAEEELRQAVQALFDAFLLIDSDSDEETDEDTNDEEDSEGSDEEYGSEDENADNDSSEDSESSSDGESSEDSDITTEESSTSGDASSGELSEENEGNFSDSAGELSGYMTDIDSDHYSPDDLYGVPFDNDEDDGPVLLSCYDGVEGMDVHLKQMSGFDRLLGYARRPFILLPFPSSSSFWP